MISSFQELYDGREGVTGSFIYSFIVGLVHQESCIIHQSGFGYPVNCLGKPSSLAFDFLERFKIIWSPLELPAYQA